VRSHPAARAEPVEALAGTPTRSVRPGVGPAAGHPQRPSAAARPSRQDDGERGRGTAWHRLPLLLPGLLALVLGLAAGLWRLGAWVPEAPGRVLAQAAAGHGALMICGFFGVVITLERAVALAAAAARGAARARPWAQRALPYTMPLLAAAGTAAQLQGASAAAALAWLLAALALLGATAAIGRRQPEPFVAVLALGAAAWACGNVLLLAGAGPATVVPWWLAFLVLTIAGERLELSRLAPRPPGAAAGFALAVGLMVLTLLALTLGGVLDAPGVAEAGAHGLGAALVALALWLLRHDLARRTVRQRGLTRFVAVCLLAGYAWLLLAGALVALHGLHPGTGTWDAALHALLLGFVFSMVFGHAPIILPAVLRVAVPWARRLVAPLLLLHVAVALRSAGSLADMPTLRQAGAWCSVVAIVGFIATVVSLVQQRHPPRALAGAGGREAR
jgi:hypothetical protein